MMGREVGLQLKRALRNLIEGAALYGRQARVALRKAADEAVVTIEDVNRAAAARCAALATVAQDEAMKAVLPATWSCRSATCIPVSWHSGCEI